ncbi:MAG: MFS transporter [Chitinophagales bacterium]|nr:MFS transporter [Chitinophagales bacterium]MCO5254170.1 MFS transporter [Bacteroidota bacterium]
MNSQPANKEHSQKVAQTTAFGIIMSVSFAHLLNDSIQSLIPSIYPLLKGSFNLSFTQIGLITFTFQVTASLLQPLVGAYTDKHPKPFSLAAGMSITLLGLILISFANSFALILMAVALIGTGSSIFHPESSKIAYMASGGRRGWAQSIFQVGGNTGSAIGPLLAAVIVVEYGRSHAVYFGILALIAIFVLLHVGKWAKIQYENRIRAHKKVDFAEHHPHLTKKKVYQSITILLILIFSKYIYTASISSYYTFFLIEKFHVSIQHSQLFLFAYLLASAVGTYLGGPLGDRYGRKYVIWFSILGAAPFALMLPYVNLFWTCALSIVIGLVLSSAFPAIIVYAQELLPGKIGMVSGLFYGFAFGIGGVASAFLGLLADYKDIYFVYHLCSFMLLMGLVTWWLPNLRKN